MVCPESRGLLSSPACLAQALESSIPGASLCQRVLPVAGGLHMWLVGGEVHRPFSVEEARQIAEHPPYWAICWPSGHRLACEMLEGRHDVRGRTVLDLGCGGGVVAIAAALAGAQHVVACDIDPVALAATSANAHLNGVAPLITLSPDAFALADVFDVVTLADVLYDPDAHALLPLARTLGRTVWVADSRVETCGDATAEACGVWRGCMVPAFATGPDFASVRVWQLTGGAA